MGQGGLGGVPGRGSSVWAGVVGRGSGRGGFFFFWSGRVGSAMGEMRVVGPTGRDQTYTPQGEPTFRKGGGAKGGEEGCWVPRAGVGRVGFEEGDGVGSGVDAVGKEGCRNRCLPVLFLRRGTRLLVLRRRWWRFSGRWWGRRLWGWWRGCCPRNQPLSSLSPPRMRRWWPAFMSCTSLNRG